MIVSSKSSGSRRGRVRLAFEVGHELRRREGSDQQLVGKLLEEREEDPLTVLAPELRAIEEEKQWNEGGGRVSSLFLSLVLPPKESPIELTIDDHLPIRRSSDLDPAKTNQNKDRTMQRDQLLCPSPSLSSSPQSPCVFKLTFDPPIQVPRRLLSS